MKDLLTYFSIVWSWWTYIGSIFKNWTQKKRPLKSRVFGYLTRMDWLSCDFSEKNEENYGTSFMYTWLVENALELIRVLCLELILRILFSYPILPEHINELYNGVCDLGVGSNFALFEKDEKSVYFEGIMKFLFLYSWKWLWTNTWKCLADSHCSRMV